jgi:hypothetical protein
MLAPFLLLVELLLCHYYYRSSALLLIIITIIIIIIIITKSSYDSLTEIITIVAHSYVIQRIAGFAVMEDHNMVDNNIWMSRPAAGSELIITRATSRRRLRTT